MQIGDTKVTRWELGGWMKVVAFLIDYAVRLNRLSERVVTVWVGEFAMSNQTIAVASRKGLIMIDTYASRVYQERIRKAVEKEFGRHPSALDAIEPRKLTLRVAQ